MLIVISTILISHVDLPVVPSANTSRAMRNECHSAAAGIFQRARQFYDVFDRHLDLVQLLYPKIGSQQMNAIENSLPDLLDLTPPLLFHVGDVPLVALVPLAVHVLGDYLKDVFEVCRI